MYHNSTLESTDLTNASNWIKEAADICNDCGKMYEQCKCKTPNNFHREWVYKCPDCRLLVRADSQLEHECK